MVSIVGVVWRAPGQPPHGAGVGGAGTGAGQVVVEWKGHRGQSNVTIPLPGRGRLRVVESKRTWRLGGHCP